MRAVCAVLAAALLASCASNSGVQTLTGDLLFVSRQGATGASSPAQLRRDAIAEAEAYCASQNRGFQMVELVEAQPPFLLGNFPKAEVRFRCA